MMFGEKTEMNDYHYNILIHKELMTPLFALLCFLAPLVGSYVGTKLFEYFDKPVVPSQPKQEPIDPEDPSCWNYSELRFRMMKNEN